MCWGSPQKPQLLPTSPGVLGAVQAEDEKVVPVLKKAGGREKRGRQQGEVAAQGHQRLCWSFGRVFLAKSEQESWGCCIPALGVLFRAELRGRDTDPSVGAPCHIGYSTGSAGRGPASALPVPVPSPSPPPFTPNTQKILMYFL